MADNLPIEINYSQVMDQITRFYGSSSDPWNEIMLRSDSANPTRIAEEYLQTAGIKVIRAADGRVVTYARSTALDSYSNSPVSTPNSNQQMATYGGNARTVDINGSATQTTEGSTTTTTLTKGAKSVSTGRTIATTAGNVLFGVGMVSLAGHLGKAISDSFYDGTQWEMTPSEWSDLYNESDGLGKFLLNVLYGVDGQNATMYMDEQALAQAYLLFKSMGFYDSSSEPSYVVNPTQYGLSEPMNFIEVSSTANNLNVNSAPVAQYPWVTPLGSYYIDNRYGTCLVFIASNQPVDGRLFGYGSSYYVASKTNIASTNRRIVYISTGDGSLPAGTHNWTTFYNNNYTYAGTTIYTANSTVPSISSQMPRCNSSNALGKALYYYLYGTTYTPTPVDGVEDDDQATTYIDPSLINGQDRNTVLQQLQSNYPELFDGAIYQDVPQDDGTLQRQRFVPVPYVTPSNQPVTGNNHQNNPQVNPETNTDTQLDDLIKTITKLLNPTDVPDTGEGNTPTTVVPVGSASSLWKIYNPTQAQIDSFGSWLWSSNLVDQIKKLFNDPMQAIIGVHKVFATPSIGGTATIKVGYLDSEVSSNWVDNQYTTVNCGSASLREYFGNVFDYAPYTKVQLYLPFIGIVDLDIADVMRSTISVVYHVDVLTGACLADVKVNRDGVGGVLYQYAGSAIVTYPVSAGNYMGMLAGVLSVAGGIAGTILSGGALAPALIGGAVGASHLHTDVSHSGGFSGCAGAMGSKKPYLIVSRPQIAMADNYQHYTGIPANSKVTLGNCDGYAKVKSVYVNSITRATEEEKAMIEAQLKAGVLV